MPKDLRMFLASYEKDHPEDVISIEKELSAIYECAAIAQHFEDLNKFPLILFENVMTARGERSKYRCMINVLGDRRKLAYAINSTFEDVAIEWRRRADERKIKPVVIPKDKAPCKENITMGDKIDLLKFPILKHHGMDPGPYITAGMFTCYDPDTGIDNIAIPSRICCRPERDPLSSNSFHPCCSQSQKT